MSKLGVEVLVQVLLGGIYWGGMPISSNMVLMCPFFPDYCLPEALIQITRDHLVGLTSVRQLVLGDETFPPQPRTINEPAVDPPKILSINNRPTSTVLDRTS